jgi:hypothetical protein
MATNSQRKSLDVRCKSRADEVGVTENLVIYSLPMILFGQ